MKFSYYYIDKVSKERFTISQLEELYLKDFKDYSEFIKMVDDKYEEHFTAIETPYERTRRSVYASGNRWAIENFNATHN